MKTCVYVLRSGKKEREANMKKFMAKLGIGVDMVYYVDAVMKESLKDPSTGFLAALQAKRLLSRGFMSLLDKRNPESDLTYGRLACSLTHIIAMERFLLSQTCEHAFVVEDDVTISGSLSVAQAQLIFSKLLQVDKDQWDIIYPGFCFEPLCYKSDTELVHHNHPLDDSKTFYVEGTFPLCRHALFFGKRFAAGYLRAWTPFNYRAGDHSYVDVLCRLGMTSIRPVRTIFSQARDSNMRSVIGNGPLNEFDNGGVALYHAIGFDRRKKPKPSRTCGLLRKICSLKYNESKAEAVMQKRPSRVLNMPQYQMAYLLREGGDINT
jgi:GR25 family glycosyltransferase involved in LPS biosynthesis